MTDPLTPAEQEHLQDSLQGVVMPVIPTPSPPLTVREPVVWGDKPEGWGHHLCAHCRRAAKGGMHTATGKTRCEPGRTWGFVAHPPGTACPTNCAGSVDS